jgi:predicted hydrocarbon binding protein
MQGIVFQELQGYVEEKLGRKAWTDALAASGLGSKIFMPTTTYPDEELVAIIQSAVHATGANPGELLEDFGKYIVKGLMTIFGPLVQDDWRTLEVIEFAESSIHTAIRVRNPDATPPFLRCTRESDREVVVDYDSPRKLCHIAKGICHGLADHFYERIEIVETSCMHEGAGKCVMHVKRVS